jgi:hypothetical protein
VFLIGITDCIIIIIIIIIIIMIIIVVVVVVNKNIVQFKLGNNLDGFF